MRTWLREHAPLLVYAAYRRQRVRRLISAHEPRIVWHEYSGVKLGVKLADPVATAWYDRDWPVSEEIRFLRERGILKGALVVDPGAHHAVKAAVLAAGGAGGAGVVAVEALPHNVRAADENMQLNLDIGRRVTVVGAAVITRSGPAKISFELNSRVDRRGTVTVSRPNDRRAQLTLRMARPRLHGHRGWRSRGPLAPRTIE